MTDTENRERRENRTNRATRTNGTMANVNHTHPHFDDGGVNDLFRRGPRAMTDGGERNEEKRQTMADVSHTPPTGDRDVNRVFSRGGESASVEEDGAGWDATDER